MAARPGFTAIVVLSLALGIGATTSIFSVVYAVLVDPYPYHDASRIGELILTDQRGRERSVSYTKAQYLDLASRHIPAAEDAIAYSRNQVVMTGQGLAEVVVQERCSTNFFDFLGVAPYIGRVFTARDVNPDSALEPVAVLSYKFSQRVFSGQKDVLGKKLQLQNGIYTVAGVMPERFTWTDADVYTPLDMRGGKLEFVEIFFRERADVSQTQIQSQFAPLLDGFRKQVPRYVYPDGPLKIKFEGVNEGILGKFANTLVALFGAVLLLLFIACGNVANLLLARASAREGEMAVRTFLGATRGRLMQQLFTESLILSLAGGALGVAFAFGAIRAVVALMPQYSIPHEAVIALNAPVLFFALGVSLVTAVLFGIAPALQVSQTTQTDTLRGGAKGSGVSLRRRLVLDALIAAEIAVSLLLLTGAASALTAFLSLQQKTLGYDPHRTISFSLPLNPGRYTTWASRVGLLQRLTDRLRELPGVEAASITETGLPPYTGGLSRITIDGAATTHIPEASVNLTSDGYLGTVHTPLLRGRDFTEAEVTQGKAVAVISQTLASAVFPAGEQPVGHRIGISLLSQPLPPAYLKSPGLSGTFEIVGVAGDARNRGLFQPPVPTVFVPFTTFCPPAAFVLLRTRATDPHQILNDARSVVKQIDQNQPITSVRTLEEWLSTATAYPKFATFLFGVFGGIAMLLATCGVFSVVSYAVARRIREFGIRMALGATAGDVVWLVLTGVGRVLLAGLAAGLALSILASKLLVSQMQGMSEANWQLFALAALILALATGVACIWPTRLAARVQPMEALRNE